LGGKKRESDSQLRLILNWNCLQEVCTHPPLLWWYMYTLYKQRQQQWGGRTSTQITRLTEGYKQTMETGDLLSILGTHHHHPFVLLLCHLKVSLGHLS
jgi:hypothetical protein